MILFSKSNQTFFGHFDLDNVFIDDDFSGYCDWPSVLLFSKLDKTFFGYFEPEQMYTHAMCSQN